MKSPKQLWMNKTTTLKTSYTEQKVQCQCLQYPIFHHKSHIIKKYRECDLLKMTPLRQDIDRCLEFNGYNTKMCREQGHSLAPMTRIVYLPLIDKPPAHPSTVTTVLVKAKQITQAAGQRFTIITLDQQLCTNCGIAKPYLKTCIFDLVVCIY